jgi:hypothetical protein
MVSRVAFRAGNKLAMMDIRITTANQIRNPVGLMVRIARFENSLIDHVS